MQNAEMLHYYYRIEIPEKITKIDVRTVVYLQVSRLYFFQQILRMLQLEELQPTPNKHSKRELIVNGSERKVSARKNSSLLL